MHLLITRPKDEAEALKAKLAARGVGATLAPMLEIEFRPPAALDLHGVQALIATSRNGLRALAMSPVLAAASALPVFAVGPGTAALAAETGFQKITVGPGSARELGAVIAAHARPEDGRLIQLGGDKLAFDLAGALAPHGFECRVCTVYGSRPVRQFSSEALAGLRAGTIDTVLLTSPLAARTFVALVASADITEQCQRLVYICLSHEIAAGLAGLKPAAVHVAAAPNTDATLALIDRLMAMPSAPS